MSFRTGWANSRTVFISLLICCTCRYSVAIQFFRGSSSHQSDDDQRPPKKCSMTRDFKIDIIQSQPAPLLSTNGDDRTNSKPDEKGRSCSMQDTMKIQQLLEGNLLELVPTIIPEDTMWSFEDLYYESEEIFAQEHDDDETKPMDDNVVRVARQWKFLGMDEIETEECSPVPSSSSKTDFFSISTSQQRKARRLRRTVEFSRAPTDFENQISYNLLEMLIDAIDPSHCMAGNHLSVEFWMLS